MATQSTPLPQGFVDLLTASKAMAGAFVDVIGIVVDLQPPCKTRTGEYQMTFRLQDSKLVNSYISHNGLQMRYFVKDIKLLPEVKGNGDVVLIRRGKASIFRGQLLLMSNYQTITTVFAAAAIPDASYQIGYAGTKRIQHQSVPSNEQDITLAEQIYAITLKSELSGLVPSGPPAPMPVFSNAYKTPTPVRPANGEISNVPTGLGAKQTPNPANSTNRALLVGSPRSIAFPNNGIAADTTTPTNHGLESPHAIDGRSSNNVKRPGSDLAQPKMKRARGALEGKGRLISQIEANKFCDLTVQVVKKFPTQYGYCELYVTDYTQNEEMWYYPSPEEDPTWTEREGDQFGYADSSGSRKKGFPGPFGWHCLKIELQDPHANFVFTNINEGDFVEIRNVRPKYGKAGNKLEANLWADRHNPERIGVIKLQPGAEATVEIRERKAKYWKGRKLPETEEQRSKKEKKRRQKKKRKQLYNGDGPVVNAGNGKPANAGVAVADDGSASASIIAVKLNKHVRCQHDDVPLSSLHDILDLDLARHTKYCPDSEPYHLPFINANFRARVRVVDFVPLRLEDFCSLVRPESDTDEEKSEFSADLQWHSTPSWQWYFSLLVEDANARTCTGDSTPGRLWVDVGHEEAQYLFGNDMEDPDDLRKHPRLLAKLREKLCILWGNLEEVKAPHAPPGTELRIKIEDEAQLPDGPTSQNMIQSGQGGAVGETAKKLPWSDALSNMPFECCLKEYGLELEKKDIASAEAWGAVTGWLFVHRMFGTTIL